MVMQLWVFGEGKQAAYANAKEGQTIQPTKWRQRWLNACMWTALSQLVMLRMPRLGLLAAGAEQEALANKEGRHACMHVDGMGCVKARHTGCVEGSA